MIKFNKVDKRLLHLSFLNIVGWNSFIFPVWYFFFTQQLGMTAQQSTIFLTISFIFQLVFEVPTGVIADTKGRMFSFRLGLSLIIISAIPMFLTKDFNILILSCVVNGLGLALSSGCLAPITHSIFESKYPNKNEADLKLQSYNANLHTFLFAFRAVAVLVGGISYSINHYLPLLLLVTSDSIVLISAFLFRYKEKKTMSKKLVHTNEVFKFIKRHRNVAVFLIISGFLAMLLNSGWEMVVPVYGTSNLSPAGLGLFFACLSLLSGAMPKLADKLINKYGYKISIYASLSLSMLSVVIIGSAAYPLNLIAVISLSGASGPLNVIGNSYIQKNTPNKFQSTIMSVSSALAMVFSFAIVQLDGYLLGANPPATAARKLILPVAILYLMGVLLTSRIDRISEQKDGLI